MRTSPPTRVTLLLQKGVAAARSGRSIEAQQLLQQVVKADPGNEMAWLWLSGLVATNRQKHACLEQVLRANPENIYARAGLARLKRAPCTVTDELEERLASVTSGFAPQLPATASKDATPPDAPTIKRLMPHSNSNNSHRDGREAAEMAVEPARKSHTFLPPVESDSVAASAPNEPICPACDEPVSPNATMCLHCFMPLRSVEELLGHST